MQVVFFKHDFSPKFDQNMSNLPLFFSLKLVEVYVCFELLKGCFNHPQIQALLPTLFSGSEKISKTWSLFVLRELITL